MTPERRRVAVLGGTFDPVHAAHIAAIVEVRDAIGAEEGWLVPARVPALRDEPVAPAQLRLAMLETAVRAIPRVRVLDIELRRPGVSYTVDTLAAIAVSHPGVEPWWILGADAARRIGEWERTAELLDTLHLAVVQRAGSPRFGDSDVHSLGLDPERTTVLDIMPPDVSATEVRRRVAAGQPLGALVPRPVADIIAASGLYRTSAAMP